MSKPRKPSNSGQPAERTPLRLVKVVPETETQPAKPVRPTPKSELGKALSAYADAIDRQIQVILDS